METIYGRELKRRVVMLTMFQSENSRYYLRRLSKWDDKKEYSLLDILRNEEAQKYDRVAVAFFSGLWESKAENEAACRMAECIFDSLGVEPSCPYTIELIREKRKVMRGEGSSEESERLLALAQFSIIDEIINLNNAEDEKETEVIKKLIACTYALFTVVEGYEKYTFLFNPLIHDLDDIITEEITDEVIQVLIDFVEEEEETEERQSNENNHD